MALNSERNRNSLIRIFPQLGTDVNFEILSPCTPIYNCIAWAMQYDDRWVTISKGPGYWWPDGVERNVSSEALVHAFEAEGFVMADDHKAEDGFDKVVLYKKADKDEWTHAARIISETKEYSKFGQAWDGTHSDNVLCVTSIGCENQSYGVAYAYMKRKKRLSGARLEGSISVNETLLNKIKSLLRK